MIKNISLSLAIALTLLTGCDDENRFNSSMEAGPESSEVKVNALPLIISAANKIVPELNIDNSDVVFNRVCNVAYGELKIDAFKNELKQAYADKNNKDKQIVIPDALNSDDIKSYQAVCAAYVIRSSEIIPNVNQFVTEHKNGDGQNDVKADEAAVINLMPFRLAVAIATAELYARIAVDLQAKKINSIETYTQSANSLFTQYASQYLEKIQTYHKENINDKYQLLLLQKGNFLFKSNTGYVVNIDNQGLSVYWYGTPWLANGYLLGMPPYTYLNNI